MLSWSSTDMHGTLLQRGEGKEPGLVPELRQMFVEISGDFLVFFLQEKRKEAKFLYRMSSGCSAITLTCALGLFFPLAD